MQKLDHKKRDTRSALEWAGSPAHRQGLESLVEGAPLFKQRYPISFPRHCAAPKYIDSLGVLLHSILSQARPRCLVLKNHRVAGLGHVWVIGEDGFYFCSLLGEHSGVELARKDGGDACVESFPGGRIKVRLVGLQIRITSSKTGIVRNDGIM